MRERALLDARSSPHEFVLRYERTASTEAELERLVAAERQCCAAEFVNWQIDHSPAAVSLTVTVTDEFAGSAEAALVREVIAGT